MLTPFLLFIVPHSALRNLVFTYCMQWDHRLIRHSWHQILICGHENKSFSTCCAINRWNEQKVTTFTALKGRYMFGNYSKQIINLSWINVENDPFWSNIVFEKEVISSLYNKTLLARSLLLLSESTQIFSNKGVFSFIILSHLWWPIEPKFSQDCYLMVMMGCTKWEDWSLTITKPVPSL